MVTVNLSGLDLRLPLLGQFSQKECEELYLDGRKENRIVDLSEKKLRLILVLLLMVMVIELVLFLKTLRVCSLVGFVESEMPCTLRLIGMRIIRRIAASAYVPQII